MYRLAVEPVNLTDQSSLARLSRFTNDIEPRHIDPVFGQLANIGCHIPLCIDCQKNAKAGFF